MATTNNIVFRAVFNSLNLRMKTLAVNDAVTTCHHNLLQICQPSLATILFQQTCYNLTTITTCQQVVLTGVIWLVSTNLFQVVLTTCYKSASQQVVASLFQQACYNLTKEQACYNLSTSLLQACSANILSTRCEIFTCVEDISKYYLMNFQIFTSQRKVVISILILAMLKSHLLFYMKNILFQL